MRTDIVYGYGVDEDTLKRVQPEKLERYIWQHDPEVYADIVADRGDDSFIDAAEEYAQDCDYSDASVWALVADMLERETGIGFEYHFEDDSGCAQGLMVTERMPWSYNEKEKTSSQEDIDKILIETMTELGVPKGEIHLTDIRIEYFG